MRNPAFDKDPFNALISSFEVMHRKFISPSTQRTGVDTAVSGSTAVAVLINGNQFVCANVGDSRAMIGSRGPRGSTISKALSSDHKPHRPDERARISKSHAKVRTRLQLF